MKSKEKDQEIDLFYFKESDKVQSTKKNQKAKRMKEKKKSKKVEIDSKTNKTKSRGKAEKQKAKEDKKKKNHREKRIQKKIEKNKKEREKQEKDYIEEIKFELENDVAINLTKKNNNKKQTREEVEHKKSENKKKEKAIKRIKRFFQVIFFIGTIIGIVAFAFTSPIFNIKEIKVEENSKVPEETIKSISQIQMGQNIFNFNTQDVEDRILENSYIDNVEIKRILPTTVKISVQERQAVYAVMLLDKYVYIDNQGYILEIADESNELIVLENYITPEVDLIPDKRLNGEDLEKIEDVNKILNSSKDSGIDEKITGINIESELDYVLYLAHDSKIIHIGDVTNLSEKIIYSIAILNQEVGIKGDIFVNGDLNEKFKPYFRENVDI